MTFSCLLLAIASLELGEIGDNGPAKLFDRRFGVGPIRVSKDGSQLAIGAHVLAGPDKDEGDLRVFDLKTGKCIAASKQQGLGFHAAGFSPTGRYVAHGGNGNRAYIMRVQDGATYWDLSSSLPDGIVNCVVFSADERYLVSSSSLDANLRVWDVSGKSLFAAFSYQTDDRFSKGTQGGMVKGAKVVKDIPGTYESFASVAWTPDSKHLVVGRDIDGIVPIIDIASGREFRKLHSKGHFAESFCFSREGDWLLAGGRRNGKFGYVVVYDWKTGKELRTIDGNGTGGHLAISRDKRRLLASGVGFSLIDPSNGKILKEYFRNHKVRVNFEDGSSGESDVLCVGLGILSDEKTFVAGLCNSLTGMEIRFYDLESGIELSYSAAKDRLNK